MPVHPPSPLDSNTFRQLYECNTSIRRLRDSRDMQRVPKIITLLDNPPASGAQGFTRRPGPVSSDSSGSSLTRGAAGKRSALNRQQQRFRRYELRETTQKIQSQYVREKIFLAFCHSVRVGRSAGRFVLAYCRIAENCARARALLHSPNPAAISSSNERMISQSAAFSRTGIGAIPRAIDAVAHLDSCGMLAILEIRSIFNCTDIFS